MRLIVSAVVLGLAFAGGVLGLLQAPVESSVRRPNSDQATPILPAAHSDANTWPNKPVRLNQNVIDGKSTVVCTTDGSLFPVLVRASELWNEALAQRTNALTVVHDGLAGVPLSCTLGVDIDVLVRKSTPADSQCPTAGACYDSDPNESDTRRLFEHGNVKEHSLILWRNPSEALSTMVHELGHVLGLAGC